MSICTVTVDVDVDVDLGDIDTDDLKDELESRGEIAGSDDQREAVEEMYYAFKFGKDDVALALAKRFVQEVTGRIL